MKVEEIKTIGVVGAGTMGSGIAQVAAASGFNVILRDVSEAALDRGFKIIERSLGKLTKKGKLTEEGAKEILGRITKTLELKDMAVQQFLKMDLLYKLIKLLKQNPCKPERRTDSQGLS